MSNCRVKNLTDSPVAMPFPYTGLVPAGGSIVVADTTANVLAALGGGLAVRDIFDLSDSSETASAPAPASAIPMGGQKITGLATGTALTDAANVGQINDATLRANLASGGVALGDLQKITYTPGVATGGFCDVVCAITDLAGGAISGARQAIITAIPVTEGTGNGALAAATSAVGTVIKALNPATGAHSMAMDSDATGHFSFKVTDAVNEAVVVRVEADGCRPVVKKITISGNA